jgi:hypothetical protein
MSARIPAPMRPLAARKRLTALMLAAGAVAAMLAVTAYSPTLYRIFCQVTGYGGTTQRSAAAPTSTPAGAERVITIRFDGRNARPICRGRSGRWSARSRSASASRSSPSTSPEPDRDEPVTGRPCST